MFLIESKIIIREVSVLAERGGLCTVMFADSGGAIRVRRSRLYEKKRDAQAAVDEYKRLNASSASTEKQLSPDGTDEKGQYHSKEMERRYMLDYSGLM